MAFNKIQQNARQYRNLINNQSEFTLYLGKDRKVSIIFNKEEFAHLDGLGQLSEIFNDAKNNTTNIYHNALDGKYNEKKLQKYYPKEFASHFVQDKIDNLDKLENILTNDFKIYKYDNLKDKYKTKDGNICQSKEQASYVIHGQCHTPGKKKDDVLLFVDWCADKPGKCFVRSFVGKASQERLLPIQKDMKPLTILCKEYKDINMSKPQIISKINGAFSPEQYTERKLSKQEQDFQKKAKENYNYNNTKKSNKNNPKHNYNNNNKVQNQINPKQPRNSEPLKQTIKMPSSFIVGQNIAKSIALTEEKANKKNVEQNSEQGDDAYDSI